MSREEKCSLSVEIGNEARGRFFKLGYHGGFISLLPSAIESGFDDKEAFLLFYEITVKTGFSELNEPSYSISANQKWTLEKHKYPGITEFIGLAVELSKNSSVRQAAVGEQPIFVPVTLRLRSSKAGFSASLVFSESSAERAKAFATAYTYDIEENRCFNGDPADLKTILLENARVSSSANQVTVVTQISRARLESIFATKGN